MPLLSSGEPKGELKLKVDSFDGEGKGDDTVVGESRSLIISEKIKCLSKQQQPSNSSFKMASLLGRQLTTGV